MSTGDQTSYIRGKLAERNPRHHLTKAPQFMKDGFDRWAESTEPMRVGQMEKIAAEETNMSGGAISMKDAMKYGLMAHTFGKTHGKTIKKVARTYGGEYGKKAADVAEMLGYGGGAVDYFNPKSSSGALSGMGGAMMSGHYTAAELRKKESANKPLRTEILPFGVSRKGTGAQVAAMGRGPQRELSEAEMRKLMGFGGAKLYDVMEGVTKGHAKAKEYAPRVKGMTRMAGMPQVAEAIEYLGYGEGAVKAPRRRKARGGVLPLAVPALIAAAPYLASAATGIAAGVYGERGVQGLKKKIAKQYVQEHNIGRGAGVAKRKPSARNEIVRQVMRERGVSLPEASSIVKREGLY